MEDDFGHTPNGGAWLFQARGPLLPVAGVAVASEDVPEDVRSQALDLASDMASGHAVAIPVLTSIALDLYSPGLVRLLAVHDDVPVDRNVLAVPLEGVVTAGWMHQLGPVEQAIALLLLYEDVFVADAYFSSTTSWGAERRLAHLLQNARLGLMHVVERVGADGRVAPLPGADIAAETGSDNAPG